MRHSHFSLPVVLRRVPDAYARVSGDTEHAQIQGLVLFYQTKIGTVVYAQIGGLPVGEGTCGDRVFGFHIHEGSSCSGNEDDRFFDVGAHLNPDGCDHPFHQGDLAPLFGNDGFAVLSFLTNRFSVGEIIGKTVILHDEPDDFTTQPSGNSGGKIACGMIRKSR